MEDNQPAFSLRAFAKLDGTRIPTKHERLIGMSLLTDFDLYMIQKANAARKNINEGTHDDG